MLWSTLASADSPVWWKQRSAEALNISGQYVNDKRLGGLLRSDNPDIAAIAFDPVKNLDTTAHIFSAAFYQFDRLANIYGKAHALTDSQLHLLKQVSSVIFWAVRKKTLSVQQKKEVKAAVLSFVSLTNAPIQEEAVSLLSELADDSDVALITQLTTNESPQVRADAVSSFVHCSKNVIRAHKNILLPMLEDPVPRVRYNALFVLRCSLGEASSNQYTEDEFKKEKERVVKLFK